jgi:hypothetical protein
MTVFLVEQNAFHALKLAHRAYVMVSGIITMSGTGQELLARPRYAPPISKADGIEKVHAMPQVIYDSSSDNALWIFLLVTVAMGGGAAYVSGKASPRPGGPTGMCRSTWSLLAAAIRFGHFALFQEPLISLKSFAVDLLVALVAASFGYRLVRAGQMARQYGWLYPAPRPAQLRAYREARLTRERACIFLRHAQLNVTLPYFR